MIKIHQGIDIVEISKFKRIARRNRPLLFEVFTERNELIVNPPKTPLFTLPGALPPRSLMRKPWEQGSQARGSTTNFRRSRWFQRLLENPRSR